MIKYSKFERTEIFNLAVNPYRLTCFAVSLFDSIETQGFFASKKYFLSEKSRNV